MTPPSCVIASVITPSASLTLSHRPIRSSLPSSTLRVNPCKSQNSTVASTFRRSSTSSMFRFSRAIRTCSERKVDSTDFWCWR